MSGPALDQAKRAVAACLGALAAQDQFGLISFYSVPVAFRRTLLTATDQARHDAQRFISNIQAHGGTELLQALQAAIGLLDGKPGDIFLITDGEVYETQTIVADVLRSPARIHTLGIGVASQQRFLRQLARQTGGNSRFVQPSEPIDWTTLELFQGIGQRESIAIRQLHCDGRPLSLEVPPPTSIQHGMPMVFYGTIDTGPLHAGSTVLEIQAEDGSSRKIAVDWDREKNGDFLRGLTGARLIADAESQLTTGAKRKANRRGQSRLAARCRELSETYGLASRQMALVAVVQRAGDRPGELPQTQVVPLGWPKEKCPEGYFGQVAASRPRFLMNVRAALLTRPVDGTDDLDGLRLMSDGADFSDQRAEDDADDLNGLVLCCAPLEPSVYEPRSIADNAHDAGCARPSDIQLWDHLASLCADGGLPGDDVHDRVIKSVLLLLEMLQTPNINKRVFRAHIRRVVAFLRSQLSKLSEERRKLVAQLLEAVDASPV